MKTFEAIKLLIEEDVRCDIHGDLYGHERVAEHLADRIDALVQENEELKARLERAETKLSDAGWREDRLRDDVARLQYQVDAAGWS